jgi:hypothetical protein
VIKFGYIILVLVLTVTSCNFAPGSYPYAERYSINTDEASLIKIVEQFKQTHPEYIVPDNCKLIDGRYTEKEHWYHIYFYYPKENQIVSTWLRSAENGKTTFAFVAVNNGLALGNWKEINKDFNWGDNREQKRIFEERILDKVTEQIKTRN